MGWLHCWHGRARPGAKLLLRVCGEAAQTPDAAAARALLVFCWWCLFLLLQTLAPLPQERPPRVLLLLHRAQHLMACAELVWGARTAAHFFFMCRPGSGSVLVALRRRSRCLSAALLGVAA